MGRTKNVVTLSACSFLLLATLLPLSIKTQTADAIEFYSSPLEVSQRIVGPNSIFFIKLTNWDLNTDPDFGQTAKIRITLASEQGIIEGNLTMIETRSNTGSFEGRITLRPALKREVTMARNSALLNVMPGDTITATYVDEKDAQGNLASFVETIQVVSMDAEITLRIRTESPPNPVTWLEVYLRDVDMPGESYEPYKESKRVYPGYRVKTPSDPIGVQAKDEVIISDRFITVPWEDVRTQKNWQHVTLYARVGDIIKVEYLDKFPADFNQRFEKSGSLEGSVKKVTATIKWIKETGLPFQTTIRVPDIYNLSDGDTTILGYLAVGKAATIETCIDNNLGKPTRIVLGFEVRNSAGETVYHGGHKEQLDRGGECIRASWTPEKTGSYELKALVTDPKGKALSKIASSNFIVADADEMFPENRRLAAMK